MEMTELQAKNLEKILKNKTIAVSSVSSSGPA
jgi:hypothetical protein